jgi:hypothetical protein
MVLDHLLQLTIWHHVDVQSHCAPAVGRLGPAWRHRLITFNVQILHRELVMLRGLAANQAVDDLRVLKACIPGGTCNLGTRALTGSKLLILQFKLFLKIYHFDIEHVIYF